MRQVRRHAAVAHVAIGRRDRVLADAVADAQPAVGVVQKRTPGDAEPLAQQRRAPLVAQPAVSHALARLCRAFGEPLFARQGRALVPTPLARRAIGDVRATIRGLSATLSDATGFQPQTARQIFTIGMRDITEVFLMPELMARPSGNPASEVATLARRTCGSEAVW